jgi:arsenate reductase-like glutaredoxin family protein
MVWDSKSTGTLSNVYELLKNKKTSVVFVNKLKKFFNVNNFSDFENLVSIMSDSAFNKADKKIKLKEKIISNKHKQLCLFPEANKSPNPTREHARFLDVDSSGYTAQG